LAYRDQSQHTLSEIESLKLEYANLANLANLDCFSVEHLLPLLFIIKIFFKVHGNYYIFCIL
jgi:hypothetical protein